MPKRISQSELDTILKAVATFPGGVGIEEILSVLGGKVPRRTLQRRLALLVERKLLIVDGRARASCYRLPVATGEPFAMRDNQKIAGREEVSLPISTEGEAIKLMVLNYIDKHGSIKRADAADLCHISPFQATRLLKRLENNDLLKTTGRGKGTRYERK